MKYINSKKSMSFENTMNDEVYNDMIEKFLLIVLIIKKIKRNVIRSMRKTRRKQIKEKWM